MTTWEPRATIYKLGVQVETQDHHCGAGESALLSHWDDLNAQQTEYVETQSAPHLRFLEVRRGRSEELRSQHLNALYFTLTPEISYAPQQVAKTEAFELRNLNDTITFLTQLMNFVDTIHK
jgi:hypothetical protein